MGTVTEGFTESNEYQYNIRYPYRLFITGQDESALCKPPLSPTLFRHYHRYYGDNHDIINGYPTLLCACNSDTVYINRTLVNGMLYGVGLSLVVTEKTASFLKRSSITEKVAFFINESEIYSEFGQFCKIAKDSFEKILSKLIEMGGELPDCLLDFISGICDEQLDVYDNKLLRIHRTAKTTRILYGSLVIECNNPCNELGSLESRLSGNESIHEVEEKIWEFLKDCQKRGVLVKGHIIVA